MNQRPSSFTELAQAVSHLSGQCAWNSRAGSGTGSIFTLQFGAALPNKPTQGEFSLMVYCAWRIVQDAKLCCTWRDDPETALAPNLEHLKGAKVT